MKVKKNPPGAASFNRLPSKLQERSPIRIVGEDMMPVTSSKPAVLRGLRSGGLAMIAICLFAAPSELMAQSSWTGASAGVWNTAGNWTPSGVPGGATNATILGIGNAASAALTINFNNSLPVNSLTFTNPTNSVTLSNSSAADRFLTINASGGTGITTGAGAVVIGRNAPSVNGVPVNLAASQTWSVGAGGLTVHGRIAETAGSAKELTKTGAGTLTLSGISGGSDTGNTYTGGTKVSAGLLIVNTTMADTGSVTVDGGNYRVGETDTVGAVTLSSGTISRTGAAVLTGSSYSLTNEGTVSAVLGGAGALTKSGAGTATLSAANTYSGATTISGGTLALSGSGAIASTNVIVGASTTLDVSGVTGGYSLGSGQTLTGGGTVTGAMTVAGTLSPGSSPGILTTGSQTWVNGADYNFQMLDATAAAGTGFDQIQITGTLDLGSLTSGGFGINLWSLASTGPDVSGNALNFNNTINQSWTILTTTGGITGFDAADFLVNVGANNGTGGFQNGLGGGSFILTATSNNLVMNFTAVPEPSAALLGGLGMLALLRRR